MQLSFILVKTLRCFCYHCFHDGAPTKLLLAATGVVGSLHSMSRDCTYLSLGNGRWRMSHGFCHASNFIRRSSSTPGRRLDAFLKKQMMDQSGSIVNSSSVFASDIGLDQTKLIPVVGIQLTDALNRSSFQQVRVGFLTACIDNFRPCHSIFVFLFPMPQKTSNPTPPSFASFQGKVFANCVFPALSVYLSFLQSWFGASATTPS